LRAPERDGRECARHADCWVRLMSVREMPSSSRFQVLVVGAGPVGLLAALRLRSQGISVRVIDRQAEHHAHSFPVVLHPQTLRTLGNLGVSAALFWRGRPITRLAIYAEYERRAVLDLPVVPGTVAGVLTLPQDVLRQALTNELTRQGVSIEWNTTLVALQQDGHSAWGELSYDSPARLLGTTAPQLTSFQTEYVIGADGYDSAVRRALGLQLEAGETLHGYAFFDATTRRAGVEAQIAVAEDYANSAYPLQGGQTRFSFQLGRRLHEPPDEHLLRELLLSRMPWYAEDIVSVDWGGVAEFRSALVDRFGVGRVWLAGDAAHLTAPLGVHSINVGIDEANELALRIAGALQEPGRADFGDDFERGRRQQWQGLLGLTEMVQVGARSPQWARRHIPRLIAALPASDKDLEHLLLQLRLLPSVPPEHRSDV